MRWTQTFIPTLKETPADAEITSHKLLLRAGLLRKLTGGLYTFLPLGVRALRKVERIVRDEIRPRFGLMRAKEFIMKDAYSFDASDEAAQASYQKMYDAYTRIFQRCGLKAFPVDADTGVMGGKFSHEFMVPADTGENEVVYCDACGYAANIDKARSWVSSNLQPPTSNLQLEKFATPGVLTIEALTR